METKILQTIGVTSSPIRRIKKNKSQILVNLFKVIPIRQTNTSHISIISKNSREAAKVGPTTPPAHLQLVQHIQEAIRSTSQDKPAVFHAQLDDKFIELKQNFMRQKLHGMKSQH